MKKLTQLLAVTVTLVWFAGCTYREHRWTETACTRCGKCGGKKSTREMDFP